MELEFPFRDQVDQYEKQELDQEYRDELLARTPLVSGRNCRRVIVPIDEDELIELERELDCE